MNYSNFQQPKPIANNSWSQYTPPPRPISQPPPPPLPKSTIPYNNYQVTMSNAAAKSSNVSVSASISQQQSFSAHNSTNNGGIRFKLSKTIEKPSPSLNPSNALQGTQSNLNQHNSSQTSSAKVKNSNSNQGVDTSKISTNNSNLSSKDWPPDLHDYVNRAFMLSNNELDKDRIEIILRGKLTQVLNQGMLHTKDWKNEPLPVLSKIGENKSSVTPSKKSNSINNSKVTPSKDKQKTYSSSPDSSHSSLSDYGNSVKSDRYFGKRFPKDDGDTPTKKKKKK